MSTPLYQDMQLFQPYLSHCLEKQNYSVLLQFISLYPSISKFMGCTDLVKSSLSILDPCASIFSAAMKPASHEIPNRQYAIKLQGSADIANSHVRSWTPSPLQSKFRVIMALGSDWKVQTELLQAFPQVNSLSFANQCSHPPHTFNLKWWI